MRKASIFFISIMILCMDAAIAATCEPGYYPVNGECTICPKYHACPDGENRISCTRENPAQYTDGPGATECIDCPTQVIHTDDFLGIYHYRNEQSTLAGCRAQWEKRTPHGQISFSCFYSTDNGYDNDNDDGASNLHCMINLKSCDAGYVSAAKGFVDSYGQYQHRYWTPTYDAAIQEMCRPAGIGVYSPENELTGTACPDGTSTHTDTATSADDCKPLCRAGMSKIHIDNHAFNIWPDKQTTPSLNILATNGDVCYINMAPGAGTVNVRLGDNQYHISN